MEKTLKEILEKYYLIPKNFIDFKEEIYCSSNMFEQLLQEFSVNEAYQEEKELNHICIVKRKIGKKLSYEQVEQIKNDKRSYRSLAKDYKVSLGTISKIKNNKY
ncbi:hypothetical protein [Clostridium tarantellae]|uniref:Mor transcription activator domain-containing protein n=1 Tax=Clostridium tarantellae TaxID=39493 RepID=A0A6I1MQY1_9CLOT|nr:hypothetical protein [Clostridium tarantellae]MPQ45203.1 hypothetical protein [Clostridium tarantellae]